MQVIPIIRITARFWDVLRLGAQIEGRPSYCNLTMESPMNRLDGPMRRLTLGLGAVLLAMLGALAWQLRAQDAAPPGFKSYPIEHRSASELAPQVREVLSGVAGKTEVIIDKQRNVILLQGSENAHRLAGELISKLDRRPQNAKPVDKATQSVVKGYRLAGSDPEKQLADLRRKYPASTGVSLAFDKRTGQLLAIAPPAVHQELSTRLAVVDDDNALPREAVVPAQLQPAAGPRAQGSQSLQNVSWQGFEDLLRRLWGTKATVEASRTGEVAAIRLKNAAGEDAVARVDRRHNEVSFEGPRSASNHWAKLVSVLDSGPAPADQAVQLVPVTRADPQQLHHAIDLIKVALKQAPLNKGDAAAHMMPFGERAMQDPRGAAVVARIFQQENQPAQQPNQPAQPEQPDQPPAQPNQPQLQPPGTIGPVTIEFLEGLDVIIIRGRKEDVEQVTKIIQDIERLSAETEPVIELYPLRNVDSNAVGELVTQIYNEVLVARQGRVSITPLDKPNALLLIGRRDSVDAVLNLVRKLDLPVPAHTQFQVFQLRHMAATDAETLINNFFAERVGPLAIQVRVATDFRTNAVIVHASARDLEEVERLLMSVDRDDNAVQMEIRLFPLTNTMATDLAPILQQAITGQGGVGNQGAPGQPPQPQPGGAAGTGAQRNAPLSIQTIDSEGNRVIEQSGLLNDVTISADAGSNAILVRAPIKSMDLIAALIRQLDALPQAEAQIKVFTIVNGDATTLATMLQQLFGQAQGGGGAQGQNFFNQSITASGENTLVPLRFSVDPRTNSIVASGAPGDLNVVEAILVRLDEGDIRQRKTTVYRLKNAPAIDVANAINQFLQSERLVQQQAGFQTTSPFEQLEREVVVVPEAVSNSLIVSATPRFYDEIAKVVEELDARPPMVMIQVLIAEVSLDDFEEFGAEFGIQDSLLFDRSIIGGAVTAPGYAFNNAQPANVGSNPALGQNLAGQTLSHFSLGRQNGNLGYGGLVLSASNESISILIRALQDARRLQVLSRPEVMTLDNQSAFIQVGQRVPYVTGTSNNVNGFQSTTDLINVGLLLGVTPRISPDGLVVMEIDAENSSLSQDQGITIAVSEGVPITQPIINTTLAQTTVSARSGQTVVLGGLIRKTRGYSSRRVPYLSDIPLLGRLFRYDSATEERSELLIIMTPYIVRNENDAEWLKQVESDRMSWCLADVVEMHGPAGLSPGYGLWGPTRSPAPIIYPDVDPHGEAWQPLTPFEGSVTPGDESLPPSNLSSPGPTPATSSRSKPSARSAALSPLDPPHPKSGDSSSRRLPGMQMPLAPANSSQATPQTGYIPSSLPGGQPLRMERSDNATVFYAPPSARPLPNGRILSPEPEVTPAYFQQPTGRGYTEAPIGTYDSTGYTPPSTWPSR